MHSSLRPSPRSLMLAAAVAAFATLAAPAQAYIGPGAGFALLSSALVLFTTVILVFLSLLVYPFRLLYRLIRYRNLPKPWVKRLIIIGFDGQDPKRTDAMMAAGQLPNFKKLADAGCYTRLGTTYPSISPVAWSSFCTGTHPAKHNIYDFLDRDVKTYMPLLSSTEIGTVTKFLKLGRYKIPLHKPTIRLLRKSKPFWTVLGQYRNWSTVLRVPITFPPDKFYGAQLSAMCVPDLLGTQGTFFQFTTRKADKAFKEGGIRIELEGSGDKFETRIEGPPNLFRADEAPLAIPMTITLDRAQQKATVNIDGEKIELQKGKLSPWTTLTFKAAPGMKVQGTTRLKITELDEHFSLYMTPINIDPEKPAMPISHPSYYSTYLAKKIGSYCTLGLAEDTWALNEGVTDDADFLEQAYSIDNERTDMFFEALRKLQKGSLVCVWDGTDRIQHMFWRYTEQGHPAARGKENPEHADAIEQIYLHNDQLLGRVLEHVGPNDLLMVLSDHGFTSFRRGVNLNRWLLDNGYLHLKEGADGKGEWLREVDWSRTKAYTLGLTGLFLNVKGREAEGIVAPGEEAQALKHELMEKLKGLVDPETGDVGINECFDTAELYQGPYLVNAPDLIVGYNEGYRTSWDCATGVVNAPVFEDNAKAWSGDHCVDPRLVPGIFFCNRPIHLEDPTLLDIAPTACQVFGIDPPPYMEGRAMFDASRFAAGNGRRNGGAKVTAKPDEVVEVAS